MHDGGKTLQLLTLLMRPIARFCLQRSIKIGEVFTAARAAYVEEAERLLAQQSEKVNVSRISAATGMHRQEVDKLLKERTKGPGSIAASRALDVVSRVLSLWQTDARFVTSSGKPRILTINGPDAHFPSLVFAVSRDTNPGTILFELERSGHAEKSGNTLKLLKGAYTPASDSIEGFEIVSRDVEDLISAAAQNIEGTLPNNIKNLHARTEFDNVRPAQLAEIRAWLVSEGHKLHRTVREYLSRYDQDSTPDPTYVGNSVRISLTTFSLIDERSIEIKQKDTQSSTIRNL